MKNIIRTCNLSVRFSKFTFNIEIYEEFVEFLSKLFWRETLFNPHPSSFSHGTILHQALNTVSNQ